MGIPDGAHTHGDGGGGGIGTVLLVFLVAIVAAAAITPIVTAITVLIHILAIAVIAALVAGVALVGWRLKRGRALPRISRRKAATLPGREQAPELEQQRGLHLHGVSAQDVAAILRQHNRGALRDDREHP